MAGNSVFAEEIHLGSHPAPAEIHGSLSLAPSKVWPGHLSTREGETLGPWGWQAESGTWLSLYSGVPESRAGTTVCLNTAELVL